MLLTKRDAERIGNKRWRMEHLYKIRTEDARLDYLRFNEVQEEQWAEAERCGHKGIEFIIDKARKEGVSTFWAIYYLDDTLFKPNTVSGIIAHKREDVQKLFKIVKLAYSTCPKAIQLEGGSVWRKPEASYDSKNELSFSFINSSIYVSLEIRGDTINNLHVSEAAHIKDRNRILASLGAVPQNGLSNITIESTANGVGDWFEETFNESEAGTGPYKAFFFGWWRKALNVRTPLPGYKPSAAALEKAKAVKSRYNVVLSLEQLCWWDAAKSKFKRLMDQEHPTISEDSFMTSANMVFDGDAVRQIATREPIERYAINVDSSMDGKRRTFYLNVFIKPKPGHSYVLGCDPAEGGGGDDSAIELIDEMTLEQVAEFVSDSIIPADLAQVVDKSCRYFNNALAVVERNNHGHTVLDRLKDTYKRIYVQVVIDEKLERKTKKLGWITSSTTRDLVLDNFEDSVLDSTTKIFSAILKSQMMTFVTDDTGRREAKTGHKDDTILSFAIALKVALMPQTSYGVWRL